ncbi:MAG TPA: hypothetical protein VKF42_10990 [Chitinivibrionales bacterium]|jgi:hypothetical protein|nr:hypothetical protein [Chitinivibrionales bacterium]
MALTFEEKLDPHSVCQLLLRGMGYYLSSWHDIDETSGMFGTIDPQVFNMRSVGSSSPVIEYVVRPHLQALCALSAFLYRNETALLEPLVTKDRIIDIVRKGIAWACDTHLTGNRDVEAFLERKRWGENWRSSLWAALLGLSCRLAREALAPELVEKVKRVLAYEADRFVGVLPPSGCDVDTKLEENAFDVLCMSWAINLCDGHPSMERWKRTCAVWALNIASSQNDRADHSEYLEKSVSHFATTQTLFPDLTAENHGFFHPDILCYGMWVVLSSAAYALHGRPAPEYFRRTNHQQAFDLLLRFCLPTGMIYAPGGQDLPYFMPRPFSLAWGLWNNDPRAFSITGKLLSWMNEKLSPGDTAGAPWVLGFTPAHEGWELLFQSQVGFELAMLAVLPFPEEFRFYSSGQIESAVDTRHIYPFVEVCYRRNVRMTRSVAWKALSGHPVIGLNVHSYPELVVQHRADMLGIPATGERVRRWDVVFHNDRVQKDGFETMGRLHYFGGGGELLLSRDVRVVTWGDDGLLVFDRITAQTDVTLQEQLLSPIHIVNDVWTKESIDFSGGSQHELFTPRRESFKEISCPSFWASVEDRLLFQFVWGRTKGLAYSPSRARNSPPYWKNCRVDHVGVHVDEQEVAAGTVAYEVGFFVGAGKSPRPFKCMGQAGEFFEGIIIMDGKNTVEFS